MAEAAIVELIAGNDSPCLSQPNGESLSHGTGAATGRPTAATFSSSKCCAEPLGRCAASGHHSANLGDRVTTERCRLSGATEELVPEHRSSARECIAAARRGQKPSDRCRHPGWSPHQSRMYRVSGPQVREVFDGDPSPIALRCEPKVHQGSPPRRPDHCSPSPAGPGSASCQSRGHPAKPVDGETGRYVSKFRTSPKPLTC
jgi:hypothetical protein